jgi:hypothetical protein
MWGLTSIQGVTADVRRQRLALSTGLIWEGSTWRRRQNPVSETLFLNKTGRWIMTKIMIVILVCHCHKPIHLRKDQNRLNLQFYFLSWVEWKFSLHIKGSDAESLRWTPLTPHFINRHVSGWRTLLAVDPSYFWNVAEQNLSQVTGYSAWGLRGLLHSSPRIFRDTSWCRPQVSPSNSLPSHHSYLLKLCSTSEPWI